MAKSPPKTAHHGESTQLIHARSLPGPMVRTVNPPIQRGSTVLMDTAADLYDYSQPTYGRQGLSAQTALTEALNTLEGAVGTCLYPSGLAAITGAMLAVLRAGDDVLVVDSIYAPTRRFCDKVLKSFGVSARYYDPLASAEDVVSLATDATRMIVLESPGSLTFEMQDIPGIARLARQRDILTAVDNTWAAGLTFKPLDHGVDLSIQALTKYVGGHADVFMGSTSTSDHKILKILQDGVINVGWAVSPDDAYQILRGLRTLPVRIRAQSDGALAVALWLQQQPEVVEVICPHLPGSRGHDLWKRDFTGGCGLFAFVLQPGPSAAVNAFLDALKVFGLGFSWGGFESLAIDCDPQLGVRVSPPSFAGPLMRLHIGLEDVADLTADLRGALDAYASAAGDGDPSRA